jgi:hypothetical protein
LGRAVDSTRIDAHSIAAQELLLAQNMGDRFRVKITFAVEVTIEAATCEPRIGHDVINRYGIEAMAVEQSSCAADYSMFGQVAVLGRIRHRTLHEVRKYREAKICSSTYQNVLEHIVRLSSPFTT